MCILIYKEALIVGLSEKLGGLIVKDKFETAFKNALRRQNLFVAEKESDNFYEISNGSANIKVNVSEVRRAYERSGLNSELDRFVKRTGSEITAKTRMVSFTNAQELLRLMLVREQDVTRNMITMDFVGGLKKTIVYTPDDEILHYLDSESLKRWDVPQEVVFSAADRNICRMLSRAEMCEETLKSNIKVLDIKIPSPAFCSSLMLCNEFRPMISQVFGDRFFTVAPSRESFLVLQNISKDIIEGLGTVVLSEYRKAKFPLTTDVIMYTSEGIQSAGRFSIGHN